jgi:hypothetical protein
MSSRLRVVVLGYIVRGPLGGMTWHYLQYVLGLARLGHEVLYIEDSGDDPWSCYDPRTGEVGPDCAFGVAYASSVFEGVGFSGSWGYYDAHTDTWHGSHGSKISKSAADADLLINVSGSNELRSWADGVPRRVYVDTDPAFTQVGNLKDSKRMNRTLAHNVFVSFGENVSTAESQIVDDGMPWRATRQPIVLEQWSVSEPIGGAPLRTVMQWDSYPKLDFEGQSLGMKSESFRDYLDLPGRTNASMEIAVGGPNVPWDELKKEGWRLVNPLEVARDPFSYREYIAGSAGEFSVAKAGYVSARTGWFSERSAAFLASGRPVVVQDTGFSTWLGVGSGVLTFSTPTEAESAIDEIQTRPAHHGRAARKVAESLFDSDAVLSDLVEVAS